MMVVVKALKRGLSMLTLPSAIFFFIISDLKDVTDSLFRQNKISKC